MSVLLVEDDAVVADAVARSLVAARQLDARVTRADSMGHALGQIARTKFALVMTDLDLPDSSGLATLVTLRHATDAMVVALTADKNETLSRQALECGANYVVCKRATDPAELERLLRLAALQAQTGDALGNSEARFRDIFELAAVGIALRSLDGRWLRVNQKLCEILGYPREELVTLSSIDLTPQDERDAAMEYNERMTRGEVSTYSREKRYLRKDGSIVWVSLAVNVVKGADDRPSHVISVIQDLQNQIANGSLFLRGAPPEHLVLYDVSQTGAIAQAALIKGIVPPPTDNTPAEAHKAFAAAINQYDAGLRYDLPQRFGNPPTPSYTYVPGGNSCGVTSLRLALNPWAVILFGGPGPPRTTAR